MREEIIISGFGGQGVMLAGTLLCHAGMREGKFVTFFPSYGAEMRGGTANCQVIISDNPIGSPMVSKPDILISFNKPSYDKFSSRVKKGGAILANTSLYTPAGRAGVEILEVPANNLAEKCGSALALNMVMLGAFVSKKSILEIESILSSIPEILTEKKKKLWEVNSKAARAGFSHLQNG